MPGEPNALLAQYRHKDLLVDTNLLLLFCVGVYDRGRIEGFKRTGRYTLRDFNLLVRLIDAFARKITTPQILAETDNLARQLSEREREAIARTLAIVIPNLFELYVPSAAATQDVRYSALGLTDCATIVAAENALVLTDDFRLSGILQHLGRDAINFTHLRALSWD